MKFDLEIYEIHEILRNGTTNQQQFVEDLSEEELELCLKFFSKAKSDTLIYMGKRINDTFRGAINGGALYITDDMESIDGVEFTREIEDDKIIVFDWRLY